VGEPFFIEAAGHRLEAAWFGAGARDGRVLVLLHEGLGSVSMWRNWPDQLSTATGLPVMAYSRWGYGGSDPVTPPRPLRYMHDEALDSLPEVLDRAGIRDCVPVGHSDGASISLIHAGSPKRSSAVRALALLAPHVFCEDLSVKSIAAAKVAYETTDLREKLTRHHGANVDGAFWGWNRAWLDPGFRRWNLEEFLPHIDLPVLVVQGKDDEYGTLAQVDAIERGVKGRFEKHLLERCGHSPHRDQQEATTRAIVELLRSLPPAG
jgi:pimeloyl-ACP methyl ester carboxylesterase